MVIVWLALFGATIVSVLLVALLYVTARGDRPEPGQVARWAAKVWVFNVVLQLAILYFAEPAFTGPYWGGQYLFFPLLLSGALAFFGLSLAPVRLALDNFTERVNGTVGSLAGDERPLPKSSQSPESSESPESSSSIGSIGSSGAKRSRGAGSRLRSFLANSWRGREGDAPRTGSLAGALVVFLVLLLLLLVNGAITVATTWFNPNTHQLAAIPHIIVEPASTPLPPTDVNHLVLVSHGGAAYLGQQALSASQKNLGSLYHTDLADYTLQSVDGHLYWIAPLVSNNVWANLGNWESPGFVAVDAEDPSVPPALHTGFHMRYLPGALFNHDLLRHVYLSGYTNANLVDPTLEVNDDWKPYYTISLMAPTRGFTGDVVKRVLLVDPQSGAIQSFAPPEVPQWVDRIIPASAVLDYLTWWGQYTHAPWFNPSGANEQTPDVPDSGHVQLLYDQIGPRSEPVWLVPMTSSSGNVSKGTVVLFDTRDNTGRLYQLAGLGSSGSVQSTFAGNPANTSGYQVSNVQLYDIYGEPTWVATFYEPNPFGEIFQAVGLVDARHLRGSNVIMAPNKSQALAEYARWLSDKGFQTGQISPTGAQVTVHGKVLRISSTVQAGTTVYSMLLAGQLQHIFEAGLAVSPDLPLVQPGDTVSGTYFDTGELVVTFTSFTDLSLQLATPTPGDT